MAAHSPARQSQDVGRPAPEPGPDDAALPLDVVFELLSNERRRRIVRRLRADGEATTLGALAEHIASIENDKPESALSSDERKRVYICLYQSHLPKMDDAGVIDFDGDRKTVEVGENLGQLTRYLPAEDDAGRPDDGLTAVVTDLAYEVHSRMF